MDFEKTKKELTSSLKKGGWFKKDGKLDNSDISFVFTQELRRLSQKYYNKENNISYLGDVCDYGLGTAWVEFNYEEFSKEEILFWIQVLSKATNTVVNKYSFKVNDTIFCFSNRSTKEIDIQKQLDYQYSR